MEENETGSSGVHSTTRRAPVVKKVVMTSNGTSNAPRATEEDLQFMLQVSSARVAGFHFPNGISTSLSRDQFIDALWAQESVCIGASDTLAQDLGVANRKLLEGKAFGEVLPASADNFETINSWYSNALSNEPITASFVLPSGSSRYYQFFFHPKISNGQFQRLWVVARDITKPHRAMVELRTAEEHYRTLVERPGLVLLRTTPTGAVMYISPHVRSLLGYGPREFVENPALTTSLLHPDDEEPYSVLVNARKTRAKESVEAEYRVRFVDGSYHWIFERQTPKIDVDGSVLYYDSVILDIQERKQLQNQLRHAQRMETLGTLTSGIAHDFNNYLAAILGQLNLASEKMADEHPCYNNITLAEQATLNCSAMSRRLLSFGRVSEYRKKTIETKELLSSTEKLLRHAVPADIETKILVDSDLSPTLGDFTELQQVLLNLGINARDAMPDGGTITISARHKSIVEPCERAPSLQPGRYVEIKVEDTGTGIPQAHLDLIFDPYFTTKAEQRGSGLGLSLSYSIIQALGGSITVDSTEGQGSTFTILLPTSDEVPETKNGRSNKTESLQATGGTESILAVDDDPMVLTMVETALKHQGYTVYTARNGREALTLFENHGSKIELLLLDYSMEGEKGDSIAATILEKSPDLPVLLTSGYGENVFNLPVQSDFVDFIAKPYPVPELAQSVRNLLDIANSQC